MILPFNPQAAVDLKSGAQNSDGAPFRQLTISLEFTKS
jgi:hypothetical protein